MCLSIQTDYRFLKGKNSVFHLVSSVSNSVTSTKDELNIC